MPISTMFDVSMLANTHAREIARKRPSVESIYRYGASRMTAWLSILESDAIKDMPKTAANIAHYLTMTRARIGAILPGRPRIDELTDVMGYLITTDRAVLAYEILVETSTNLLIGHRGVAHAETCAVCYSLAQCQAVDQAARDALPPVQRADAARRALLPGPPVSHRCHITSMRVPYGRAWRVTCLTCGVVSSRPHGYSGLVADIARDHARLAGWRDAMAANIG